MKTVEGAVECGANELIPILRVRMGGRRIGSDVRKVRAAILVAQIPGELGIDEKGNIFRFIYRVKIRDKRNSSPVVTGEMVIAGNNDAQFARIAAAQLRGRFGANVRKKDGGMTSTS